MNNKSKIFLVTGGCGFIGSHMVDKLIKMKHKVIVIDDLSGGFLKNINLNFKNKNLIFLKKNIKDLKKSSLLNKVEYVFHLLVRET